MANTGKFKAKSALFAALLALWILSSIGGSQLTSISAQIGVRKGDWIEYEIISETNMASWFYEIPCANGMSEIRVEVLETNETRVTLSEKFLYENNTSDINTVTIDVELTARSSNFAFVIPADLRVNNRVWIKDRYVSIGVEGTHVYAGSRRIYITVLFETEDGPVFYYYDKQTGFLLEVDAQDITVMKVLETNMWKSEFLTPDFVFWTFFVAMIIVIVVHAILRRKRSRI